MGPVGRGVLRGCRGVGCGRRIGGVAFAAAGKCEGGEQAGGQDGSMDWHGNSFDSDQGQARVVAWPMAAGTRPRSEEHTSELQSLMRISYAVFCLKKKNK